MLASFAAFDVLDFGSRISPPNVERRSKFSREQEHVPHYCPPILASSDLIDFYFQELVVV